VVLALAGLLVCSATAAAQSETAPEVSGAKRAAALRAQALQLGYNLDYEQALTTFRDAIAADPTNPAGYRLAAATMWINALFRQGAVTADDYLGQARADVARRPMPPDLETAFRTDIDRALALADDRLRDRPGDADAHFQVGAAYAFLTTYKATIEGRVLGVLGTARRAYNEHERALALDAQRHDAGLTVGIYRYGVSTLSMPLRLLAGFAGFSGGHERGLQLIEDAARYPSDVQTNARFTLIVIYNREHRFNEALRLIHDLQELYPRNRLLWLEAGSTALRARRFEDARAAIEDGMDRFARDSRPRAYGEEARWRYYHGAALVGLGRTEPAQRELAAVLAGDAAEWLRGRAHQELGKIADLRGNRAGALAEYRLAIRICHEQHDPAGADEAAALIKSPYR
jgi:tetratricopeptide (TPR) repeat protein